MALEVTKKTIPLKALSVSIEDIKRIVSRLEPLVEEEKNRELALLLDDDSLNEQQRADTMAGCEQAFRITVTIFGKDGETLFGYGNESFDSPNIPEPIQSIYITNNSAYHGVVGRNPLNSFILNFDFSKPPLLDNKNPVSSPTPNFSNLTVEGDKGAWVASIQQAIMDVLEKKSNKRAFLHANSVYDIGLLFFGLPVAIYLCWRLAGIIESNLGTQSSFLVAGAYVYIFFIALYVCRILFGYTKWAFPIVELTNNESKSKHHRTFWKWIIFGILASAAYDLLFIV